MMLKEDALAKFKVLIRFESRVHDEVIEISAKNSAHAAEECERMLADADKVRLWRESKNVYCSRRAISFDLLAGPWREDLMCLSNLEDNV